MTKSGRYGTRPRAPVRPVRAIITVVCDDTETAVAYFDLLRHEVKERRTVRVYGAPRTGADAKEVIEFAGSKRSEPAEPGDAAFVLIDVDTNPDTAAVRALGTTHGVTVLLSKPCYEVWTLAHLQDTGEAFTDCDGRAPAGQDEVEGGDGTGVRQQDDGRLPPDHGRTRVGRDRPMSEAQAGDGPVVD